MTTADTPSTVNRETITPAEALLWLASLETNCLPCHSSGSENTGTTYGGQSEQVACSYCGGSSNVPVLDLREPCPCMPYCVAYRDVPDDMDWQKCYACTRNAGIDTLGMHGGWCLNCRGRNWLPRQGREALHQAMNKEGWYYKILQAPHGGPRLVKFWRSLAYPSNIVGGEAVDDHIAAYKAMRANPGTKGVRLHE